MNIAFIKQLLKILRTNCHWRIVLFSNVQYVFHITDVKVKAGSSSEVEGGGEVWWGFNSDTWELGVMLWHGGQVTGLICSMIVKGPVYLGPNFGQGSQNQMSPVESQTFSLCRSAWHFWPVTRESGRLEAEHVLEWFSASTQGVMCMLVVMAVCLQDVSNLLDLPIQQTHSQTQEAK